MLAAPLRRYGGHEASLTLVLRPATTYSGMQDGTPSDESCRLNALPPLLTARTRMSVSAPPPPADVNDPAGVIFYSDSPGANSIFGACEAPIFVARLQDSRLLCFHHSELP